MNRLNIQVPPSGWKEAEIEVIEYVYVKEAHVSDVRSLK